MMPTRVAVGIIESGMSRARQRFAVYIDELLAIPAVKHLIADARCVRLVVMRLYGRDFDLPIAVEIADGEAGRSAAAELGQFAEAIRPLVPLAENMQHGAVWPPRRRHQQLLMAIVVDVGHAEGPAALD